MLLHGIMASMAEFYSRNLSTEAKKGIAEKAKKGGTIGYAPTGYINTTRRVGDRDAKTVVPDPQRAEHVVWAFETYAQGNTSLSDLVIQLAARGLTTRDSRAAGRSLSRAAVHRMLTNPYYTGQIRHLGVLYPGQHEPLVTTATFNAVQDVLAGRKIAGDRSWRQHHYLKGSVVCARCGSRLGYSINSGRGGQYAYFFCLGRAKKRTDCDLPYLQAEHVESMVAAEWHKVALTPKQVARAKQSGRDALTEARRTRSRELTSAEREVARLTTTKQRLLDAYLAEVVSLDDFKHKQEEVTLQLNAAQARLNQLTVDDERVEARLNIVLSLLENAGRFYDSLPPEARQEVNQAAFRAFEIGITDDETKADPTVAVEAAVRLSSDHPDDDETPQRPQTNPDGPTPTDRAAHGPGGPEPAQKARRGRRANDPGTQAHPTRNPRPTPEGPNGGSNVNLLAEAAGFEPARGVIPNPLSRRAH